MTRASKVSWFALICFVESEGGRERERARERESEGEREGERARERERERDTHTEVVDVIGIPVASCASACQVAASASEIIVTRLLPAALPIELPGDVTYTAPWNTHGTPMEHPTHPSNDTQAPACFHARFCCVGRIYLIVTCFHDPSCLQFAHARTSCAFGIQFPLGY